MNESSFSLLTQNEIDTLIGFLMETQKNLDSEVLSQDSVDKLIHLIRNNDINKVRLDYLDALSIRPETDILKDMNIRQDVSEVCELRFSIDKDSEYVQLFAYNTCTQQETPITPSSLDRTEFLNGASTWGYSITPILFDKIARIFTLKYSRKTYEEICALHAVKNFGDANHKLPAMYYPTSHQLLDRLL